MSKIDEKGRIPYETAQEWARNWQKFVEPINEKAPKDKPFFPKAYLLKREQIAMLLEYSEDIRIYFGMDDEGNNHLMMVGVDKNGNDILPDHNGKRNDGKSEPGEVLNKAHPCPVWCDVNGGLG